MPYKISGNLNEDARIIIIKESDWSIETTADKVAGNYEFDVIDGDKVVVAVKSNGQTMSYGDVGVVAEPKLYLPFDTDYNDASNSGHTITPYNMTLDSDYKVVGSSSAKFNSTDGYVSVNASSDWAFGTNDFTISFYAYFNGYPPVGRQEFLCDCYSNPPGWMMSRYETGEIYIYFYSSLYPAAGGTISINSTINTDNNQWYFMELKRVGTNATFYIDGVPRGTCSDVGDLSTSGAVPLLIGVCMGGNPALREYLNGYIDDFKVI